MIPQIKQDAVTKALQTTFGVNEPESMEQLMKGLSSALVFKIMVHRQPYILRIIMNPDAIADPEHYFGCMQTASGAGLAPPICYLNREDRISITGFVKEKNFPRNKALVMMPALLRRLHALPKFPYRINYFEAMEKFMARFRAAAMLPEAGTRPLFTAYDELAKIYPRNDEDNLVACHNDLKPENIIFDGMRPWIIDWEGAFLNDRYMDLAMVANFVVRSEQEEAEYLETYFGEAAGEYRQARFFVMGQMLHLYYFTFLLLTFYKGKTIDTEQLHSVDFRDYHDRMWKGEIDLAQPDVKLQYAWTHREEFLRKMNSGRLQESLQIINRYHPKI